jgi:hypothetical protein
MTEKQRYRPRENLNEEKEEREYKGPKKIDKAKGLLDGIEDLVSKEKLADNYTQPGGQ